MRDIPWFLRFFRFSDVLFRPPSGRAEDVDVVLVWGNKETGRRARRFAELHNKPVWCVEDGFFRSVRPGSTAPLSLVLDDEGVYYDARSPSRLESLLQDTLLFQQGTEERDELVRRAAELLRFVQTQGLSKYNDGRRSSVLGATHRERILLIDQTLGDASIEGGLASRATFDEMLDATVSEFPRAEIVVKQHPEVVSGRKQGCLAAAAIKKAGARVLSESVGPFELLKEVDHVMTVTSQFGFDALCAGRTVTCFGVPFYAGWGLSEERASTSRRTQRRSLEELCAAAWLLYPSYVHPVTGESVEVEEALEHLALQRSAYLGREGKTFAVGFSKWKQPFVAPFLEGPDGPPEFVSEAKMAARLKRERPARVVHWGQRISVTSKALAEEVGVSLHCVEDGFLRSNVLGSDLTCPLSLVVDGRGIYYDATRPSDLEHLLEHHSFSELERASGRRLIDAIRTLRVSKYNVQRDEPIRLPDVERVVLVVGQVDDDAAIALGTHDISSNEALLRRVREAQPDAFIVFKPHPDVVSGNRKGGLSEECERLANWVEKEHSIAACLDVASEVHTMTSLVGFEALLRDIPVFTYGMPFYAGWGLTHDEIQCSRRSRSLCLEELVHATLNLYPSYYDRGFFLTAEEAVKHLSHTRDRDGRGDVSPTLRRKLMRLKRYLWGVVRGA